MFSIQSRSSIVYTFARFFSTQSKHKQKRSTKAKRKKRPNNTVVYPIPKNPYLYQARSNSVDALLTGDLYTPETCSGRALGININKAIHLGLYDVELFNRYGNRAVALMHLMRVKDLSIILNAFGKRHHEHLLFLNLISTVIPLKLNQAQPLSLSLIINAFTKFEYKNPKLLKSIADDIPHKLPHFSIQNIVLAGCGLNKLLGKNTPLFDDIALEITRRKENDFEMTHIGALAFVFGQQMIPNKEMWLKLSKALEKHLQYSEPCPTLCITLTKFVVGVTEAYHREQLLPDLCTQFQHIDKFIVSNGNTYFQHVLPTGWLNVFQCFTKVQQCSSPLIEIFLCRLGRIHTTLTKSQLCQTLWGFSKLYTVCNKEQVTAIHTLLTSMLPLIEAYYTELKPSLCFALMNACSYYRIRDVHLIKTCTLEVIKLAPELTSSQFLQVISIFVQWGVKSTILFQSLIHHISIKLPLFTPTELVSLFKLFRKLHVQIPSLIHSTSVYFRIIAHELPSDISSEFLIELNAHVMMLSDERRTENLMKRVQECIQALEPSNPIQTSSFIEPKSSLHTGAPSIGRRYYSTTIPTQSTKRRFPLCSQTRTKKNIRSINKSHPFTNVTELENIWQKNFLQHQLASYTQPEISSSPFLIVRTHLSRPLSGNLFLPHYTTIEELRRKGGLRWNRWWNHYVKK